MAVHLDVAERVAAFVRSDNLENPRELRPDPVSGSSWSQREFPVERFENIEMWIGAHAAKVRRSIATRTF